MKPTCLKTVEKLCGPQVADIVKMFHSDNTVKDEIDVAGDCQNLSYDNLVACCTDGAAAMMGKNKGFNR